MKKLAPLYAIYLSPLGSVECGSGHTNPMYPPLEWNLDKAIHLDLFHSNTPLFHMFKVQVLRHLDHHLIQIDFILSGLPLLDLLNRIHIEGWL